MTSPGQEGGTNKSLAQKTSIDIDNLFRIKEEYIFVFGKQHSHSFNAVTLFSWFQLKVCEASRCLRYHQRNLERVRYRGYR